MSQRFFIDHPITADCAVLSGSEAHHLLHVMRGSVGDDVILFDGSGYEFDARIARLARSHVELLIVGSRQVDRELPCTTVLGVALPKAERQRWLIEKLVELGVARIVPLRTRHSVVHPDEHGLVKLRRAVIEATKQCGRTRLLEVGELTPLGDFLWAAPAGASKWIADPTGILPGPLTGEASHRFLAVGPEGGWSDNELSLASAAGWHLVSLGARVLRIETACLVLAALVSMTKSA